MTLSISREYILTTSPKNEVDDINDKGQQPHQAGANGDEERLPVGPLMIGGNLVHRLDANGPGWADVLTSIADYGM